MGVVNHNNQPLGTVVRETIHGVEERSEDNCSSV